MQRIKNKYFLAAACAAAAAAVFLATLRNDFVLWDDDQDVLNNPHIRSLDWSFFRWAFTDATVYWNPLTWISHAVDYALWGLNPAGHHLASVLLHSANTFLLVLLAVQLIEKGIAADSPARNTFTLVAAGITGLVFGLHPIHVESVAWASERKDVLFALFYLLSVMSYAGFAEGRADSASPHGPGIRQVIFRDKNLMLAFAYFILAVASKPTAVTLPAVLLILDWYPYRRMASPRNLGSLLIEKVLFFAVSIAVSLTTVVAQKHIGAMQSLHAMTMTDRLLVACRALPAYLVNMIWPFHLNPLYLTPPDLSVFSSGSALSIVFVAAVTGTFFFMRTKQPVLLSVWVWYVITLFPTLGMLQSGPQSMADRFSYIPSIGPFFLLGSATALGWIKIASYRERRRALVLLFAALVMVITVFLSLLTLRQIGVWNNSITLWSAVIEREPERFPLAYNNRGMAYQQRGQMEMALADYSRAIRLDTGNVLSYLPYTNRGTVFAAQGKAGSALADFNAALSLNPRHPEAYLNRGQLLSADGRTDLAMADFNAAISLDQESVAAYEARGGLLRDEGAYREAADDFSRVIALDPANADAFVNRGLTYREMRLFDQAIADYSTAIKLKPSSAEAFNNRGNIYRHRGEFDRALADYDRAIELNPSVALAYCNRGTVLGLMGRFDSAIESLSRAIDLDPNMIRAYRERGELYRQRGNRQRAGADFRRACGLGSAEACAASGAVSGH